MTFESAVNKYFPYLVEIRKRLLFALSLFLISSILGFVYYEKIINLLLSVFDVGNVNIVFTSPFQFFTLAVNLGLMVGIAVSLPLIIIQLLSFLKPALKKSEFRLIISLIPFSLLLFAMGLVFGVGIMKYIVTLFYQKSLELNIGNFLDISMLLSKIALTGALMGIAFQFPIVITILIRLGAVERRFFIKQRPFAYGIALVFAALLPPTDILSLLLLTLPLVILFEITLLLNKLGSGKAVIKL